MQAWLSTVATPSDVRPPLADPAHIAGVGSARVRTARWSLGPVHFYCYVLISHCTATASNIIHRLHHSTPLTLVLLYTVHYTPLADLKCWWSPGPDPWHALLLDLLPNTGLLTLCCLLRCRAPGFSRRGVGLAAEHWAAQAVLFGLLLSITGLLTLY